MGSLQEAFDRCFAYQTAVHDALSSVWDDWGDVVDAEAEALVDVSAEELPARLASVRYSFADDRRPAGLDAAARSNYDWECAAIRDSTLRKIARKVNEMAARSMEASSARDKALDLLSHADLARKSDDMLLGQWVLDVVMGVHLGMLGGGEKEFREGPDREAFRSALAFVTNNATNILKVLDSTADCPSDAVGLQLYREARRRVMDFAAAAAHDTDVEKLP